MDLQQYFDRIGFQEQATPDLETLKILQLLHTKSIPFENLDPLLKIPVSIDLDSIQKKLIQDLRGGYCFEQNLLFYHVLKEIGFTVTPLAGRVLWNKPEHAITQQTHMLLQIHIGDKNYISDVGFGGQTLTGPLEFIFKKEQATPHEFYRILEREGYYLLQTKIREEWKNMYRFSLKAQYFIDYEIANWYTSTYPGHIFTSTLSLALAGADCRYALFNNKLNIHHLEGKTVSQFLETPDAIKEVLQDIFKIQLPVHPDLDRVLSALISD